MPRKWQPYDDPRVEDPLKPYRVLGYLLSALLVTAPMTDGLAASTKALRLPPTFNSEKSAQAHCPRDVVVWLNIPTGIYHEKGMRYNGRTKHGMYVCKKEADAAGDRDTRNGQ